MAATEECAQRACFRMADVTVMHSVTTRATGLTATVMGRGAKLAMVSCSVDATLSSLPVLDMVMDGLYDSKITQRGSAGRGASAVDTAGDMDSCVVCWLQ